MTLERFSLEKIYMSFIRPILKYADVIWDSQNQSLDCDYDKQNISVVICDTNTL